MKSVLIGMAVALIACNGAFAGARDEAKVIMPDNPSPTRLAWGWADAVVVGDTVYISGVVASTNEGDKSLEDAYTRAFDHIGEILTKAGASWDDVVDITTYHTDVTAQMQAISAVKNRHIRAPFPAWTAIQVARLIPDKGITEIKMVAKLPARAMQIHR